MQVLQQRMQSGYTRRGTCRPRLSAMLLAARLFYAAAAAFDTPIFTSILSFAIFRREMLRALFRLIA